MSYHEVQRANSTNKTNLHKEDQKWLKDNSYKNVGWDNIIKLFKKIEDFLDKYRLEDLSLEELFLEADRIGNKYLTKQEMEEYNQQLSKEVGEISEIVDKQFPDTEVEIIDFSQETRINPNQKHMKKKSKITRV